MKTVLLPTVTVFIILIGLSYAYAEELRFGFSEGSLISDWINIEYKLGVDGGYDVWIQQNSVFHYDTIYDIPEQIHFQKIDQQGGITDTTTIMVRDEVKMQFFPVTEIPVKESKLTPEIIAKLDEKIAEREKKFEEALRCLYGNEGNSMFQAFLEERIAKERIYFKSLPINAQDKKLILAKEACDVFFEDATMISQSPEMLGKFKAEQKADLEEKQRLAKLERPTDYTDPLTQEDFDKTIEAAENLPKPYIDPYKPFEGVNRGGYTEGAECVTQLFKTMCPLKAKAELLSEAVSTQQNYDIVQQLVCDTYLTQYEHLTELPNWLAHCEIE